MNILVISDDTWHPAEVIEMGLRPLNEKFDMTYIRSAKDILTPEYLGRLMWRWSARGSASAAATTLPGLRRVSPR